MTTDDAGHLSLAAELAGARERVDPSRPLIVGISGAVGIGKSTLSAVLAALLADAGLVTEVMATDGFLRTSAELEALGLMMRKGFPESYDGDLLDDTLRRLHAGEAGVAVPLYSHEIYDRVPGPGRVLERADVVIVEGVNALQPPAAAWLDVAVYIETDEEHLRRWFTDRFMGLCAEAAAAGPDSTSYYRMFVGMAEDEQRALAAQIWDGINGVNLRDHIGPSRERATHVLRKAGDHSVVEVTPVG